SMTEKLYTIEDLLDVVTKGDSPPPCDHHMNIKMLHAADKQAEGLWHIDDRFINGHKVVMGGFISGAIDIVMAYASASLLYERNQTDGSFASINLNVTYHRPLFEGNATVQATIEQAGNSVAYLKGTVSQNDKLVATATSSVFLKG